VKTDLTDSEARLDLVLMALTRLRDGDMMEMAATWQGGKVWMRQAAWAKVNAQLRDDPRRKLMDDAREWLASWVDRSYTASRGAISGRAAFFPGGSDLALMRRDVLAPALDAVGAMLVDEVLTDEEREELLAPLRSVTELPPEPIE
jgi:hypothetical protein